MPLKLGSQGELVIAWQRTMVRRFASYARESNGAMLRIDGYYGYSDQAVQAEYQRRTRQPVTGVVSDDDLRALGLLAAPPPPPPRHRCLTFRGTGGIVGLDYTSRVAAAAAGHVIEVPVPYAATMGPLPVGAAAELGAPSGRASRDAAVEWAARWIESTTATFVLGGYSQGADAASRVRAMLEPGGRLARHRDRYVCGYMFGNPARAFGHTFYLGAVPGGHGIADWRLPQSACTWDWLECVHPDDLYANVPLGDIGEICTEAYKLIMDLQFTDLGALAQAFLTNLLGLLDEAGIDAEGIRTPERIVGGFIGGLISGIAPKLGPLVTAGQNPESAAAAQAAVLGIRFAASNPPTAPHITYEFTEALPGLTYLGLAIQHVTDWSQRTPVRT